MSIRAPIPRLCGAFLFLLVCCQGCQWFVDDSDREVYRLVEKRQMQALGETRSATIDKERVPSRLSHDPYKFVPNPRDPAVPAEFTRTEGPPASAPATEAEGATTRPDDRSATSAGVATTQESPIAGAESTPRPMTAPAEDESRPELGLGQALAYAFAHSREFQTAKEDLYLAALALTLERRLWAPLPTGNIGTQYANYGEIRNFDHAMAAVAQVGVEQRLPLGGTITAKVIDNLMRDLTNHVTTGETGQAVLSADIPLLRGAGLVAYESRFQAERNLIYAVRAFETFRRTLSVQIAGDYFNLQQLRQAIRNAGDNTQSLRWLASRARAYYRTGRVILLEAQRADQEVAFAENREVDATATYRTALDQFKLRIGMPTGMAIDIPVSREPGATSRPATGEESVFSLEDALEIPWVSEEAAIRAGLQYRLDLLNDFDRIDDAARGVNVAENNLLPDLSASGSVTWDTNPGGLGTFKYNEDRATWRAGINLELPLNRYTERNALRNALVFKRRAERNYQAARDTVILQVRRALRTIEQQRISLQIQLRNRDLAVFRRTGAQIQFLKNRVSNREVTDAEAALLDSRNRLAAAQSQLRLAILQFRRDTGTLRINDEGKWSNPVTTAGVAVATSQPNG